MDPKLTDSESNKQIDAEVEAELAAALGDKSIEQFVEESTNASEAATRAARAETDEKQLNADGEFEREIKRGRIAGIQDEDVFVELAGVDGKLQGIVPLRQFDRAPRPGSIMDFVVERYDATEGVVILSREGAVTRATWEHLKRGSTVEARVVGHNKGGLELELVGNIKAFMPAGQIDFHHIDELETCVGQKYHAVVQEIERTKKRLVVSRRMYLEQERARLKVKLFETIEEGQILEGTVSNLMEYGAFVDIGGADGLLHISDMAYTRIKKPSEVVSIGQKVTVMVLKVDKEKERISLGLKQIAPDPWVDIDQRVQAGNQISGRALRVADFGVFVEVEEGVEGLLPASEITWKRHARPTETVKVGDVLRLVVLQVDPEKKRLTLSLKQAAGDPWADAAQRYPVNMLVTGTVQSTTDFGAFVEIEPGLEGLVHISELSSKRVNAVEDVVKAGESHEFRVLEIDDEQRRIRLSKKAVDEPIAEVPAENAGKPQAAKQPAAKRNKPLRGGMDIGGFGGIGLGNLKL